MNFTVKHMFPSMFKSAPDAKGLILVGEFFTFPKRDPRSGTVGGDGCRPNPGFSPLMTLLNGLVAVKNAFLKYSPNADIVFWKYNWGNFPKNERLKLIENLPSDVSAEVIFEMVEQIQYPNHTMKVPDYTITFSGPGQYFTSEAEALHKRGMRLYAMTNTAEATWDCAVLSYIPEIHMRVGWLMSGLSKEENFHCCSGTGAFLIEKRPFCSLGKMKNQ